MVSVNSLLDNFKERVTNPFFGTFIAVWLIRNWDLVFTIFNFEENTSLDNKKKFIRDYFTERDFWFELFQNLGTAFVLLLVGYIFIIVSRVILNIVYHNFIPYLNSKFVSKLVVSKARFDTVKKFRDDYFLQIQDLEEERVSMEQSNTLTKNKNIELEAKLSNLNLANDELIVQRDELKNELKLINTNFNEQESQKNSLVQENLNLNEKINYIGKKSIENLLLANNPLSSKTTYSVDKQKNSLTLSFTVPDEIKNLGKILKNDDILRAFYNMTDKLENDSISNRKISELDTETFNKFIKLNLIDVNNGKSVKITEKGIELILFKIFLLSS